MHYFKWLLLLIYITKLWNLKLSIPPQNLNHGERSIGYGEKKKLAELKQNVKPKQIRLVLSGLGVKKSLEELQQKTVFVTIDKASKHLHLFVENTTFHSY